MTAINPDAAKEAARCLVTRFVFDAVQSGASEAQIVYNGQQIKTAYCLNGDWQRQDDMPVAIWPQILRRIRNMAFLTLGPQPPRQEGSSQWVINDEQKGEERHYTIGLVITHDDTHDDIRITIPDPIRQPYKKPSTISERLSAAMKKWPQITVSSDPPGHATCWAGGLLGPGYVVGDDGQD